MSACLCECWEVVKLILLCLELQAQSQLVATSVDVLAVEESRECQLDTCTSYTLE